MSDVKTIRRSVAATPDPHAAAAAREAYARGGNAVDAACAAVLTLCVATPAQVGFGGYGGSLIAYIADRNDVVALDFDSRCPLAYREELFEGVDPRVRDHGYLAITVPAVVAGIDRAIREFGKLTFHHATDYALSIAENGFRVDAKLKKMLDDWRNVADPVSLRAHFPDGTIPREGDVWVQSDLAKFIRILRDEGPRAMYRGDVAKKIVAQIRAHGGILSEDDFSTYEPTLETPLRLRWRGHEVCTPPPPSGGITTLQILKGLERENAKAKGLGTAEYLHTFVEVAKASWASREKFLGDPAFVDVPIAGMLAGEHTVNVCTADKGGNVVSMHATQGNLFGSQVVIEGLGLAMNHGMSRYTFDSPGAPNAPQPGKRMHHNMSPMLILDSSRKPRYAFGLPGGEKIINMSALIAMNLVEFDQAPAQTIAFPRIHTQGGEPLQVTSDMPKEVVEGLQRLGHEVNVVEKLGGPANLITIDATSGEVAAVAGHGKECVAEV